MTPGYTTKSVVLHWGGRGGLSVPNCEDIKRYFGIAILSNLTAEETSDATMARFLHLTSTDENPQHQLCKGWCFMIQWEKLEKHEYKIWQEKKT